MRGVAEEAVDIFDQAERITDSPQVQRLLLESRLRYHHRCLQEDATNPDLTASERLMLVRDRVPRMQEIERELERTATLDSRITVRVGASRKPVVPGRVDWAK